MKNLLLTLTSILLLLSLLSCNEQKIHKEYYAEGSLKCEAEVIGNTKNGFYREYYPSGKLKFKGQYIDGLLQGKSTTYYEKGEIKEEKEWLNGKLNGVFKAYYSNGNIEQTYRSVAGKIEDTLIYFYSNGVIEGKTPYKNGRRIGRAVDFYETGELKGEYYWHLVDTTNGIIWYRKYNREGQVTKEYHTVKIESKKVLNSNLYRLNLKLLGADHEKITVYIGGYDENYRYTGEKQDTVHSSNLEATYLYQPKAKGRNIVRGVIRDWQVKKLPNGNKSTWESFAYFTDTLNIE